MSILLGAVSSTTAATPSGDGGNLDGLSAILFSWTTLQSRVIVESHPDYAGLLYVKLNGDDAAADDWDHIVQPGVPLILDLPKTAVLAIFGSVAATYGTDFVVKGMA